jgi:hypothetical protein
MKYLLCRNKVADFAKWKEVFDSHQEAHKEAGLKLLNLFQNLDDSNEVFILFEVSDIQKGKAFVYSPQVPDAIEKSGVIEKPDIYFLE